MRDVKMLGEEKWKEKCDRYFSSMGDLTEQKSNNTRRELLPASDSDTILSKRNRQSIRKWVNGLDLHGSSFLSASRSKFTMAIWLILILFSLASYGLLTYLLINDYFHQAPKLVLTSATRETHIDPSLSVTFCNLNILKVSKLSATRFEKLRNLLPKTVNANAPQTDRNSAPLSDMLRTTNLWETLQSNLGENLTSFLSEIEHEFSAYENQETDQDLESLYHAALEGDLSSIYDALRLSRHDIQSLGHQRTEMLRHCWINGRNCLESEMKVFVDSQKGNCVTVKSSSKMDGFERLSLLLDTEPYEYVGVTSPVTGFVVSVHDSNINHDETSQFITSPGENLNLKIHQVSRYHRITGCTTDPYHNQQTCLQRCLGKNIIKTCGCSISLDAALKTRCRYNIPYEYVCKRSMEYLIKKGRLNCDCPKRCRERQYDIRSTRGDWPSRFHSVHIERSLAAKGLTRNYAQLRETMVKVDIDTTQAQFTDYKEQYDITWLGLLWRMGGLSAMFIGISALSILEIIWLLGRSVTVCCTTFRRKATPKVKDEEDEEAHSTWENNQATPKLQPTVNKPTQRPRLPSLPVETRPSNNLGPIPEDFSHIENNFITLNDDYDEIDHIYAQVWDPTTSGQIQNGGLENNVNAVTNRLSGKKSNYNIKVNNKSQDAKRNYFTRAEGSAPDNRQRNRIITPHLVQTYSTHQTQTRLVTGTRPGIFYM
ncbi:hypothetical protein LOTGIDRAFT_238585 [Lottia gigantea]|uniref:Uncharacterized protein n=1 Tax=Lottia gigantea TaxID=225164 RepID=V4ASW8_LOTGI|nr:hypothetical protein LOTGIDRAFT_238585 [Lottia gigantea]ESP00343.1 hypothetical protein LOTGIDRAFT_238585 [Lottia gigantea]